MRVPDGWEISDAGKLHLRDLGVANVSPAAAQVATDLRQYLQSVNDLQTKSFVEEAIKAHELGLFRSAVVMSWLGAVYVLQAHVVANGLAAFNTEAKRIDAKWKPAKTADDLGRMKESDFLDRLESISMLGKNAKSELKVCLNLRNGCGHPNTLKVGANAVAHHLETLLLNVFQRFG
ncbi:MAG: hypothetical protein GC155_01885 [Alphaproteobacteria bacterium]|nr:hypothetical protein [Alphaproteobacteria bacterium]